MSHIDDLRDLLLASPKFREEAFAHEGTEAISAAADDDLAHVRKTVVTRYLDWVVEHALCRDRTRYGAFADMTEEDVLRRECREYGINPNTSTPPQATSPHAAPLGGLVAAPFPCPADTSKDEPQAFVGGASSSLEHAA